jgi:hypothetical protein
MTLLMWDAPLIVSNAIFGIERKRGVNLKRRSLVGFAQHQSWDGESSLKRGTLTDVRGAGERLYLENILSPVGIWRGAALSGGDANA